MAHEQQWADRRWGEHVRDEGSTWVIHRTAWDTQINVAHLAQRPAASNGSGVIAITKQVACLMRKMKFRAKEIRKLIVSFARNDFLARHEIGAEGLQTSAENRPPISPPALLSKQVERDDSYAI
jgi:hypothetical protein